MTQHIHYYTALLPARCTMNVCHHEVSFAGAKSAMRPEKNARGATPAVLLLEALVHVELEPRIGKDAAQRWANAPVEAERALLPHRGRQHAADRRSRPQHRRRACAPRVLQIPFFLRVGF